MGEKEWQDLNLQSQEITRCARNTNIGIFVYKHVGRTDKHAFE